LKPFIPYHHSSHIDLNGEVIIGSLHGDEGKNPAWAYEVAIGELVIGLKPGERRYPRRLVLICRR